MDTQGVGGTAAGAGSPLRPSAQHSPSDTRGNGIKRKRSGAGLESSPGTGGEDNDAEEAERRRQPGVKRACNECRQQKVCVCLGDSENEEILIAASKSS
jgi:hypothetical protein